MNTTQIMNIMKIFSFEDTRMDFAKYAYQYCVDKKSYYKVSNTFSFESSKTELNNYIQGR